MFSEQCKVTLALKQKYEQPYKELESSNLYHSFAALHLFGRIVQ